MHKLLPALAVFLWPPCAALAQPDASVVTYTGLGATANQIHVSDRLYPYGFAVDFCGTTGVDGVHDNSGCLQNALNATGVNFQSLEIQPAVYSASGSASISGSTVTATTGSFANLAAGDVTRLQVACAAGRNDRRGMGKYHPHATRPFMICAGAHGGAFHYAVSAGGIPAY